MKTVRYSREAQRALRRHGNVAARLRKVMAEYAADPVAHADNVTQMAALRAKRMGAGDFRIIFEETEAEISVSKIGPCGSVYER